MTIPMLIVMVVAAFLLTTFILVERVFRRHLITPVSRNKARARSCYRFLTALCGLIYAFCYLEVILCSLVNLRSSKGTSPAAWAVLLIGSLPFVVLPLFFGFGFERRTGLSQFDAQSSQQDGSEEEANKFIDVKEDFEGGEAAASDQNDIIEEAQQKENAIEENDPRIPEIEVEPLRHSSLDLIEHKQNSPSMLKKPLEDSPVPQSVN